MQKTGDRMLGIQTLTKITLFISKVVKKHTHHNEPNISQFKNSNEKPNEIKYKTLEHLKIEGVSNN